MRRLVYILVLVSGLGFSQGVEVFNAMDILEYNESLRIFQKVKNDVVDEYEVTFISAQRSLVIRRGSTGEVMEFVDVRVFREENGLFVFRVGWLLTGSILLVV